MKDPLRVKKKNKLQVIERKKPGGIKTQMGGGEEQNALSNDRMEHMYNDYID